MKILSLQGSLPGDPIRIFYDEVWRVGHKLFRKVDDFCQSRAGAWCQLRLFPIKPARCRVRAHRNTSILCKVYAWNTIEFHRFAIVSTVLSYHDRKPAREQLP